MLYEKWSYNMTENNNQKRMESIYHNMWSPDSGELLSQLERSLNPRSSDMLYEVAGELGISARHTVLDAGSGLGIYTCGLASRFRCHVVGLEIARNNLAESNARAYQAGLTELVTFQEGNIQAMPFHDATFDFIWCRDMLVHVRDLRQAFAEFARALKPGGSVIIHNTFATGLMEPAEAQRLYEPLDIVAANMSPTYFEESFKAAGLEVVSSESIGSEWLEHTEEQSRRFSKELLQIARMRRQKETVIADFGQGAYEVMLAVNLWHIYLLLGKLSSTIYTLRKIRRT
jgi:ubiquinone/menaquinone biosynthesis C-methylase UbiE